MSFLKSIFSAKDKPIQSYSDFWNWFSQNAKTYHKVVNGKGNIEKDFFNKLAPRLNELKEGFWYMTGMYNENTAELIITADGIIKNIVFVEELIDAAPAIEGWKFTALKPALDIKDVSIEMSGYKFSSDTLSFWSNNDAEHPDEIDISITHDDYNTENKTVITNGVHIFLDNYLGELEFAVTIDTIKVVSRVEAEKELIPIQKLKDYLQWRQKEFIERYEGVSYDTGNDQHSILEAELASGETLIATINTDLLLWENKASHPWILSIEIAYDGSNNKGMPDADTFNRLQEIEDHISSEFKHWKGHLGIGRQTASNKREVYFACNDFRKPAKIMHKVQSVYANKIPISYEIYKDKYWQSFDRFNRVR